jgi:uncharacterized membrane protein YeaQ/YmgE (transglycosylase-associated protein family)
MHIIWVIIIGFVAGIIARFLAPGPNNPAGFILTTLLGIGGAFIATFIGQARSAGMGKMRVPESSAPLSARWSSCSSGTGWSRRALSQTPPTGAGFKRHWRSPRRFPFDNNRARFPTAAGNCQSSVIPGSSHFQNRPPRFIR